MSESAAGAWEPHQFPPGMRVRIALSPECECWKAGGDSPRPRRTENGRVGTIVDPELALTSPPMPRWALSHTVKVMFDRSVGGCIGIWVAPCELAPPDEAPS